MKIFNPEDLLKNALQFTDRREQWEYVQREMPDLAEVLLKMRELGMGVKNLKVYGD